MIEGQVQVLLDGVGVLVAPHRDVTVEDGRAALDDVDVHNGRANVQQRDDAPGVDAVVHLVAVLEGEDVHVHDRGVLARLADGRGVVADLVLLHRHQQHVHVSARAAAFHDLVVQRDVLDVEGDVLLGFPVDGLGQLLGRHLGQADLLDDHGVARHAGGDVVRLDLLGREEALDGVDDRARIHDGAVDDGLGGKRLEAQVHELVLVSGLAARLQLHGLDRR